MPRYFLELSYQGTAYSGFQAQQNANTIQQEISRALSVLYKNTIELTGSSRTDTGVHALQNYFHFDIENIADAERGINNTEQFLYKMNAVLPPDIVVTGIHPTPKEAHCRFDAISREYKYYIYQRKNPFLREKAYYYPYTLDWAAMEAAAAIIKEYKDFTSFSKRNTQVRTFECNIVESKWEVEEGLFVYHVEANRFLRGMVRALTATMLQVGRGKITLQDFRQIIEAKDCTKADFSVPGHGLFLIRVTYPEKLFKHFE